MRWRLLEINSNLPSARFLAIQVEGDKPEYEKDWRKYEPLFESEKLSAKTINQIGNRHGDWHDNIDSLNLTKEGRIN